MCTPAQDTRSILYISESTIFNIKYIYSVLRTRRGYRPSVYDIKYIGNEFGINNCTLNAMSRIRDVRLIQNRTYARRKIKRISILSHFSARG